MAIKYRENRSLKWIVYFRHPFTGKLKEVGFPSRDDALREESLIKHRLKFERESFREDTTRENAEQEERDPTLADCFLAYLQHKQFGVKSVRTVRDAMGIPLQHFGNKAVKDLTREDLTFLLDNQLKTGVKPVTARGRMSVLRAILRWSVDRGFFDVCPVFPRLPKAYYEKFIPPTEAELVALLEHSAPHLRRVILIGSQLGVRVGQSELFKLKWGDVDFTRSVLIVHAAKKRPDQPWREVPIRKSLLPLMQEWKAEDDKIPTEWIINYHGDQVGSVKKAWGLALRRAGITRRLRLYDLRHLFATNLIDSGADIGTVTKLMGHSSPTVTLGFYQHISDLRKRAAIESLPEIPVWLKNMAKNS